jgi:hypothetical protein
MQRVTPVYEVRCYSAFNPPPYFRRVRSGSHFPAQAIEQAMDYYDLVGYMIVEAGGYIDVVEVDGIADQTERVIWRNGRMMADPHPEEDLTWV